MTGMTDTMFPLGAKYLYGGSIATVEITGTTYRKGIPMPVVFVSCPDFGPGLIRLVGNQTYNLGDITASDIPPEGTSCHVVVRTMPATDICPVEYLAFCYTHLIVGPVRPTMTAATDDMFAHRFGTEGA